MPKLCCPRCKKNRIWHKTTVITVKSGKRERYYCRDCGHTFYHDYISHKNRALTSKALTSKKRRK